MDSFCLVEIFSAKLAYINITSTKIPNLLFISTDRRVPQQSLSSLEFPKMGAVRTTEKEGDNKQADLILTLNKQRAYNIEIN
jgi:hypothetical protein